MTFFVYFDLIIKNNIASFLVVLIIGKVVYSSTRLHCIMWWVWEAVGAEDYVLDT